MTVGLRAPTTSSPRRATATRLATMAVAMHRRYGPPEVLEIARLPVPTPAAETVKRAIASPERFQEIDDAVRRHTDDVVIPISELFQAYKTTLCTLFDDRPEDTTEENLQARIRGNLLMAVSNKFGRIVLSTGNKSELSVGYCTLYGDMAGGMSVIRILKRRGCTNWRDGSTATGKSVPGGCWSGLHPPS